MMKRSLTLALLCGTAFATPSYALESGAFLDAVTKAYRNVGYDLAFGASTVDGDTVLVEGVSLGVPELGEPVEFDVTLTFEGVEETAAGYTVDRASIPDVSFDFQEEVSGHFEWRDLEARDLFIPADGEPSVDELFRMAGSLSLGKLTVTKGDATVLSVDSIVGRNAFDPADAGEPLSKVSSLFSISGIDVDLAPFREEDEEAYKAAEYFGLERISGDIEQTVDWTMSDGRLVMDRFSFDFPGIGSFDTTFDLSGLTPAVIASLYEAQKEMLELGPDSLQEKSGIEQRIGLQMLQAITVHGFTARFDDDGITAKVLDLVADEDGVEVPALIDGMVSEVETALAGLGVPDFQETVVSAVRSFLTTPESIEVTATPPDAKPLLVTAGALATNPAAAVAVFGLDVKANSPK